MLRQSVGRFMSRRSPSRPVTLVVLFAYSCVITVSWLPLYHLQRQHVACDVPHGASGRCVFHPLTTPSQIEAMWSEKVSNIGKEEYLHKREKLREILPEMGKWNWTGKAFPRVPAILDFKDWVLRYSIQSPKHLLVTCVTDPELEYVFPNKTTTYIHGEGGLGGGDLHSIPELINPARDFDMVIFSQTIEHLYDPFLALVELNAMMVTGGYVFTSAPVTNKPHMTPFHFHHMTPMGLAMLFERAGFEVLEIGAWGNVDYERIVFGEYIWPDYVRLSKNGTIRNQADTNPDDAWLLARKR